MPKNKAKKLIHQYNTNDPFKIASFKNICVLPWALHSDIKGFYKYIRKNKFIFYNMDLTDNMKRFVCAHELGHALLHPRSNTPFMRENTLFSIDKIEVEANIFAVELLIPDEVLYEYRDSCMTVHEAADRYGVPRQLAYLKKRENF